MVFLYESLVPTWWFIIGILLVFISLPTLLMERKKWVGPAPLRHRVSPGQTGVVRPAAHGCGPGRVDVPWPAAERDGAK